MPFTRIILFKKSPPAREVWIEIAMRTETEQEPACRLPRGRCGLKLALTVKREIEIDVASREGGVD